MVLGFGEMLKDDRPSEDIWMDDEALVAHFKERDAAHGRTTGVDDDDDDWGPEGSTMQNALADELLREAGLL